MGCIIDDEQRQWYVLKEAEQRDEMKQEFPSTPLEAFLTSGRRVFDSLSTMQAEGETMNPLIVYDVEPVTGTWPELINQKQWMSRGRTQ